LVKLSIGHPNDWIGALNGNTPFPFQKIVLGICVATNHHWLSVF